MRLFHPAIGYLIVGYLMTCDGFGISWGFSPLPNPREGEHRFKRAGQIMVLSWEEWKDYRWWALSPVHLCYRTISPFDPEVWDSLAMQPRFQWYKASRWTGRTREVWAVSITTLRFTRYGYRWILRVP